MEKKGTKGKLFVVVGKVLAKTYLPPFLLYQGRIGAENSKEASEQRTAFQMQNSFI